MTRGSHVYNSQMNSRCAAGIFIAALLLMLPGCAPLGAIGGALAIANEVTTDVQAAQSYVTAISNVACSVQAIANDMQDSKVSTSAGLLCK